MLNFLLKLIIIFLIGSRVVFACKVAQANILPTDLDCMPYTPADKDEESPKYESTTPEANIDISYVYNADQEGYKAYATKIAFEINEFSRKNYLTDKTIFLVFFLFVCVFFLVASYCIQLRFAWFMLGTNLFISLK